MAQQTVTDPDLVRIRDGLLHVKFLTYYNGPQTAPCIGPHKARDGSDYLID